MHIDTEDHNPQPPLGSHHGHHDASDTLTASIPSPREAENYYHGIYSRPRLIARSSIDPWVEPCGPEAYFTPKQLSPLGFDHCLQEIWESTVGPAIISYLDTQEVKWSSLDPVRIGHTDNPSPPAVIWIGVLPGSLTAENGVKAAIHCKGILSTHGINDVHVEIRESEVFHSARLHRPVPTSSPIVRVVEPFSTAVGLPISTEATPYIGGTGGFFFFDRSHPTKIFLVTARHVVIHENNELYKYTSNSQPRRRVLLFDDAGAKKHLAAIQSEIDGKQIITRQLERRLEAAEQLEPEYAEVERGRVRLQLDEARESIEVLKRFLLDATRDWKDRKNRVIGHVVLSPPIGLGVGEEQFTEDWAVVEIDQSKINQTNLIGNAVDLGIDVPVDTFTSWMYPHSANPPSFEYPGNRLHRFFGTILDEEMGVPNSKTRDHLGDPVIMVIKRGHGSGLTVGRLNNIRSVTRFYFEGNLTGPSMEVAILPRDSKSGPFSECGDSGSCVVDGRGRLAGLLTGGAGATPVSDCTYVTSANFLHKRMERYGIQADFFPSFNA